jgi:hypothetical protein
MNCVDVNVLLYAHRADLPEHTEYRELLERLGNGTEPLGLPDAVLSGFIRIITNRRVFTEPMPPNEAWRAVDDLIDAPATMTLTPSGRHWRLFRALAEGVDARGNDVADAYLAAYALDNNATWLSADRGFARFKPLRWSHPLDG